MSETPKYRSIGIRRLVFALVVLLALTISVLIISFLYGRDVGRLAFFLTLAAIMIGGFAWSALKRRQKIRRLDEKNM